MQECKKNKVLGTKNTQLRETRPCPKEGTQIRPSRKIRIRILASKLKDWIPPQK